MFRRANEFEMNSNFAGNNNIVENEMNVDIDMISNNQETSQTTGGCCNPITEAPKERCVHRTIMHEVPQDCQFM